MAAPRQGGDQSYDMCPSGPPQPCSPNTTEGVLDWECPAGYPGRVLNLQGAGGCGVFEDSGAIVDLIDGSVTQVATDGGNTHHTIVGTHCVTGIRSCGRVYEIRERDTLSLRHEVNLLNSISAHTLTPCGLAVVATEEDTNVYNTTSGQCIRSLGKGALCVAVSPCSLHLACLRHEGLVLYELASCTQTWMHATPIVMRGGAPARRNSFVVFSSCSSLIAAALGKAVIVWEVAGGTQVHSFALSAAGSSGAFSACARRLYAMDSGAVLEWCLQTGLRTGVLVHTTSVTVLAVSHTTRCIVFATTTDTHVREIPSESDRSEGDMKGWRRALPYGWRAERGGCGCC